jgi:translocation and assembly module TamB
MARRRRLFVIVAGIVIALPLALLCAVLIIANLDGGRRLLERTTDRLSGGTVRLQALAGRFPDHLQLAHLTLADAQGIWLQADDIRLDSSPLALLHKEARVELLHVGRLEVARAPQYAASQSKSGGLWLRELRLDRLDLSRVELGAPLAGEAVALRVTGNARAYSLQEASVQLSAQRLDSVPATYQASAQIDSARVQVQVDLQEGAGGPLTHLAQLPDLGALALHLRLSGPRNAVETSLDLKAGALKAAVQGTLNLPSATADLSLDLDSAAMAPRAEIAWQGLALHGQWHGPLSKPLTDLKLQASGIQAPDVQAKTLQADLRGEGDKLLLDANVGGFHLQTPALLIPDSKPLIVHAEAKFGEPARPIDFTLTNSMINLKGHWNITTIDGSASAALADIRPFVAMGGLDLSGSGTLEVKFGGVSKTPRLDASATLEVRGGAAPIAPLLRSRAKAQCALLFRDNGIEFANAQVEATNARAEMKGDILGGILNLNWKLAVLNLRALSPELAGNLTGSGAVKGHAPNLALDAEANGQLSAHGSPPGALRLSLHMRDLPQRTNGKLELTGSLDGAPLELLADAEAAADGGFTARIETGDWKSAHAQGELHVDAKAERPLGKIELQLQKLNDLDRLIGQPLQGALSASVVFAAPDGHSRAQVNVEATDVGVPAQQVQQLRVRGEIDRPLTSPVFALQLTALGQVVDRRGHLELQADGPLSGLQLQLKSNLEASGDGEGPADAPVQIDAAALLDAPQSQLKLNSLKVEYRKAGLRLLSPSVISYGGGLAVDHLRLGSAQSELQLSGRITPTLDARASLSDLTEAPLRAVFPSLQVDGRVDASAEITGSFAQPTGKVELHALGLRASSGAARGLPATSIDVSAQLAGQTAQVDAHMNAGEGLDFAVTGQAPMNAAAQMALKMNGAFDLSLFNPILEASGQRALGKTRIDAQLSGTPDAPMVRGSLLLSAVSAQDYSRGARLTEVNARLDADGDTLTLQQFSARAGTGTISASGTIKLGEGAWPVDLKVTGRNAQPLASDLLTANIDLDLSLSGALRSRLNAGGTVSINRAVINIPNALPPDVPTLNVVRAGQKPPPPAAPSKLVVALDFKVSALRAVFVRGRGIDAELGGNLHIGGTLSDVEVSGAFDMRQGTLNLAGASLQFTPDSRLSFNGSGVKKKIDPTLDFTAKNDSGTAWLKVTGFADAPVITLDSNTHDAQDQILSQLLFGQSVAQLTPLQLAQIGAALASMGGVGGAGGFNPINTVQRKLGLDRLSIGGGGSGGSGATTSNQLGGANNENNAATIEAGRYISSRVYVGAKQSTAGPTQAQVQVDLTKRLKIQTTLGTGGGSVQGATPQNDPGSSAGITYQFEY